MGKRKELDGLNILREMNSDEEESNLQSKELSEVSKAWLEQGEKPFEDPRVGPESREQSSKEPREDPRVGLKLTAEPSKEPSVELEQTMHQVLPDSENDETEYLSEFVQANHEKEISADIMAVWEEVRPLKKCNSNKSIDQESVGGSLTTDLPNKPKTFKTTDTDADTSKADENTGSPRKRRCSIMDPQMGGNDEAAEVHGTSKRQRTKWSGDDSQLKLLGPIKLPDFLKDLATENNMDPETLALNKKLVEINRMLQGSDFANDRAMDERSLPMGHNNSGISQNSMKTRYRSVLVRHRQNIILRLVQKKSTFNPPPEDKSLRFHRKLYIPQREYPGYNFIGLIIGPRGITQKKMERKTGAHIVIRGNGFLRQGRYDRRNVKPEPRDIEDLHVLIEADNEKSLHAAVGMVEKLLVPVEEGRNRHKLEQLKELAKMKGTTGDENSSRFCDEWGHEQYVCPTGKSTSAMDVPCPLTGFAMGVNGERFAADPRNGGSAFGASSIHNSRHWEGVLGPVALPSIGSNYVCTTTTVPEIMNKKEIDNSNLYVAYLPQFVDNNKLVEMFSLFGRVTSVKVARDRITGLSKCYGFVKFADPISAAWAVEAMHGQVIDGKMMAVRIAGCHTPALPNFASTFV